MSISMVRRSFSGGTIGMKVMRKAYEPVSNYLPDALRGMSIMHSVEYAEKMTDVDPDKSFLYLPLSIVVVVDVRYVSLTRVNGV
jgi:hypothetical protein